MTVSLCTDCRTSAVSPMSYPVAFLFRMEQRSDVRTTDLDTGETCTGCGATA